MVAAAADYFWVDLRRVPDDVFTYSLKTGTRERGTGVRRKSGIAMVAEEGCLTVSV